MLTNENRGRYDRSNVRYPSGLTDEEWAHVAPLISLAKRATTSVRSMCGRPQGRNEVFSDAGMTTMGARRT
jgi:hypothetical protein